MNESVLKTDQIGRLRLSEQKKTMVDAYRPQRYRDSP
jgi:hypothetical protein